MLIENHLLASFLWFASASSTPHPAISTPSVTISLPVYSFSAALTDSLHSCHFALISSGMIRFTFETIISSHSPVESLANAPKL